MQGPSVLVTGGCGYIGSHAVLALSAAGFRAVVVDDLSSGNRSSIAPEIPFFQADAGDGPAMARILAEFSCQAVMHFAGSASIPESYADPIRYYRNNTATSITLIEQALTAGIRAFVFSSTAAIYGQGAPVPVGEDAEAAPLSPYGRSKWMVEQALRDLPASAAMRYAILRYFNVAGADQQARTGHNAGASHLIAAACRAAIGAGPPLSIFGTDYATPDGTCIRDYIHVSDLAAAHVATLRYLLAGGASQVLNCGYGRGLSVREVLAAVERVSGTPLHVRETARRHGDVPVMVAAVDRLRATVEWTPRFQDIDTIIATSLDWERKSLG